MAWIELLIAGILEVVWSTCMKFSQGFTNLKFTAATFVAMAASFYFLLQAIKKLPLGTAYAIWTGIGALGAVAAGIILFKEPATAPRLFFAALLVAGIIGLKVTSGH